MANRVFQSVIYQMKDAIDRVVGVVDWRGARGLYGRASDGR